MIVANNLQVLPDDFEDVIGAVAHETLQGTESSPGVTFTGDALSAPVGALAARQLHFIKFRTGRSTLRKSKR